MINNFFNRKNQYFTTKSIEEIITSLKYRIDWNVELGSLSVRNEYSVKDFEGYVEDNSFTIRRILKIGANSFIPLVKGKVRRGVNNKVILEVQTSFQRLPGMIFTGFNIFLMILIGLVFVSGNIFNLVSLSFVLLLLSSWISVYYIFKLELKKVDEFMKLLI